MTGSTVPKPDPGLHRRRAAERLCIVVAAKRGAQRNLVCAALAARGIAATTVDSTFDLRLAVNRLQPSAVVVDVRLVGDHLAAVLPLVLNTGSAVVALAVRDAAARVQLLLAGADDCLPETYSPEELTARVVAVVRRCSRSTRPDFTDSHQAGPLRLHTRSRRVDVHGSEISLTVRESDLLSYFLRHSGEALSRERLFAEVWGYTFGSTDTVTVHVRRLRMKVEADPSRPELIQTVWGIGYRFESG